MHYNIALLSKKVELITLLSYFLCKVMCYATFALLSHYFVKYEQGLIVFLI